MAGTADEADGSALTRGRIRWYLLRFGGPLALVPSLLQPAAVLAAGIVASYLVSNPLPLLVPAGWLLTPFWRAHDRSRVIDRQNEPDLVDLVESVAGAVGASVPEEIRLDATPNASIGRHRLSQKRVLRLGIPLVIGLDRTALSAVVAHELAHAVQLDSSLIGTVELDHRLVTVRRQVAARLAAQRHRRAVRPNSSVARFLRQTQPLAFAAESEADRLASVTAGQDATARALRSAAGIDAALSLFAGFQVAPLVAGGLRPASVLTSFERWLEQADPRVLDLVDQAAEDDDLYDELLDDHPDPTERELAAAANRHPSSHQPGSRSRVALHDRAAAEDVLCAAMLSSRQRRLPMAPPSADHDRVVRAWRRGAATVRIHLLRASGQRGRKVRVPSLGDAVARLVAQVHDTGDAEQLAALRVAVAVSFAVELGDRGWIGPLPASSQLISPAETFDDALMLAVQAVDERSGIAPLVDALRAGRPRLTSAG